MSIFFVWINESEEFNPQIHGREDEKIFRLEISQNEGELAYCLVTIANTLRSAEEIINLYDKFCACIWFRDPQGLAQRLFWGKLQQAPLSIVGEYLTLELVACYSLESLEKCCEDARSSLFWDELFIAPEDRHELAEITEGRHELFYWDRITGAVSLSDISQGRNLLDLGEKFFYRDLSVHLVNSPIQSITVNLSAEWIQTYRQVFCLDSAIHQAFGPGGINTLSGESFSSRWYQACQKIDKSNYHIIINDLISVRTKSTQIEQSQSNQLPKQQISLKRSWFDVNFVIGLNYEQPRREKVSFTIATQPQRQTKTLNLQLQDIMPNRNLIEWEPYQYYEIDDKVRYQKQVYSCTKAHYAQPEWSNNNAYWEVIKELIDDALSDYSSSSFFLTPRGRKAVEHAMGIGQSYIRASNRCVKVKFRTSFKELWNVTTDHSISLQDKRFPGGKITGKVTDYKIVIDGKKGRQYVQVTLACAIDEYTKKPLDIYSVQKVAGKKICRAPCGIEYYDYLEQKPTQGLVEPEKIKEENIIKEIEVQNRGEEQISFLSKIPESEEISPEKINDLCPTNIRIKLQDLRINKILEHNIKIER